MAERSGESPRDDRRVVEALADLFDQIAPKDGLGEQEALREVGLDPASVSERSARLAQVHLSGELVPEAPATETAPSGQRLLKTGVWLAAALAAGVLMVTRYADDYRSQRNSAPSVASVPTAVPLRDEQPAEVVAARQKNGAGAVESEVDLAPATRDDPMRVVAAVPRNKPWLLDSNSWHHAQGLLPEPVLRRVQSGDYWFQVRQVRPAVFRANYPQSFWIDSRANRDRYEVDPETCGLIDSATGAAAGQLVGLPFDSIDDSVGDAACKILWNMRAADALGGGQESKYSINGIDTSGEMKRVKIASYESHFLAGRRENPDNLRHALMQNVLEPLDLDSVGGVARRTNDATTYDKIWFFVPATRRVRRVNPAARSEPIADLAVYHEDLGGFGSKLEYFKWRFIGEGETLASMTSTSPLPLSRVGDSRFEVSPPQVRAAYEVPGSRGIPWLVVEGANMVRRPVWIVEGRSEDPYHNFGKVVLYIDKEMYRIYWKLVYDRAGEYFYNAMFSYYWSRSEDGSMAAVTPGFLVGVNDRTNRAAIVGRQMTSVVGANTPPNLFTLTTLTRMSD